MAASAKALRNGSPAPGPVPEGLIRLYSMRFCPFAQRTQLVLAAKGIEHETININLKDKPDWFLKKNPFGLVPVLETNSGQIIYESPITSDYLDEVYPGKRLSPSDPYEKAKQRMFLEHFSKAQAYVFRISIAKRKGEDTATLETEFREKLAVLEEILNHEKRPYFGGSAVSMTDYMMWPWFERLEAFSLAHCLDHTPNLKRWVSAMKEDAAVKATLFDTETHKGFFKLYAQGSLDSYDYGL